MTTQNAGIPDHILTPRHLRAIARTSSLDRNSTHLFIRTDDV